MERTNWFTAVASRRMHLLVGWCMLAGVVSLSPALAPASSSARGRTPHVTTAVMCPLMPGRSGAASRPAWAPRPNWTAWLGAGLLSTGPAVLSNSHVAYLARLSGTTGR